MGKKTNLIIGAVSTITATTILVGCKLYGKDDYTITFSMNGGDSIAELKIGWGDEVSLPTNPTRKGYKFVGWYYDQSLTNPVQENIVIEADLTLYAKWTPIIYNIVYNVNEGSGSMPTSQVSYDSKFNLPNNTLTRVGFEFDSWNTKADGTGTKFNNQQEVINLSSVENESVVLFAQWKACVTEISFDKNAADAEGTINKKTYVSTQKDLTLPVMEFTRVGYNFKGWATSPTGPVVYLDKQNVKELTNTSQTLTLYAVWEAQESTITLIHENKPFAEITKGYEESITLPTEQPTRKGYLFVGWGEYVLTKDTTFKENKIYYTVDGSHHVQANVTIGEVVETGKYFELVEFTKTTMPLGETKLFPIWSVTAYRVNFDSNGGNDVTSITQDFGTALTLPTPVKTGHSFKGWYKKEDDSLFNPSTMGQLMNAQEVEVYAKWEANTYTLELNANGGTGSTTQSIVYGVSTKLKEVNLVREGYTFKGWATTINGSVEYLDKADYLIPAENTVLYAVWGINDYSIYFDENGGSEVTDIEADYNEAITLPTPTREGYTFLGWYDSANKKVELTKMPAKSLELTAKWEENEYTIIFNSNDGSGTMSNMDMVYDQIKNLTAVGYSKVGYSFAGWNTEADGSGKSYTDRQEVKNLLSEDGASITLYAQWKADDTTKYYVNHYTYNLDGVTYTLVKELELEGTSDSEVTIDSLTLEGFISPESRVVKIKADGSLVVDVFYQRKEYKIQFTGLNPDTNEKISTIEKSIKYEGSLSSFPEEFNIKNYSLVWKCDENIVTSSTKVTSDMILVANYTRIQKSLVVYSDGVEVEIITDVPAGSYIVEALINYEIDKTGYTFSGWYLDSQFTDKLTNEDIMPEDSNIQIYAKWDENSYTLNFVTDGANETVNSKTLTYEEEYTLVNLSKTGYVFTGWNSKADGSGTSYGKTATISKLSVKDNDSVTLYAQYTPISYSLVFNANGGIGSMSTIKMTYDKAYNLTPVNYSMTGYTFKGWNTEADGSGKSYTDGQEVKNLLSEDGASITLYAQWDENSYTLNFVTDGSNETVNSEILSYDEEYTLPSLSKEGHTFLGWNTKADGSGTLYGKNATISQLTDKDNIAVTLYAQWSTNSYTITFNSNGGNTVDPITGNYNSSITSPVAPEKEGYSFLGWREAGSNTNYVFDKMPARDVALVAQWEINEYTYSFIVEGEDQSTLEDTDPNKDIIITLPYGSDLVVPEVKNYKDLNKVYIFSGWYEDSEYKIPVGNFDEKIGSSDKTFYGKYTSSTYKIIYQDNYAGNEIHSFDANGTNISFMDYMQYLYNRYMAYSAVYKGMNLAAGGNTTNLTGVGAWLQAEQYRSVEALKQMGVSEEDATVIHTYLQTLSVEELGYIGQKLSEFQNSSTQELAGQAISNMIIEYSKYYEYKNNYYNPFKEGKYFDSWGEYIDEESSNVYHYANWVSKLFTPENVKVISINKSSVTYSWAKVTGAVSYEVTYVISNAKGAPVETKTIRTNTLSCQVEGLEDGYYVSLKVKAINAKESLAAFDVIGPDGENVHFEGVDLNSPYSEEVSYHHDKLTSSNISHSGDYYYIDTNHNTFYFFESRYYTFSDIEHIDIVEYNEEYEVGGNKDQYIETNNSEAAEYLELNNEANRLVILGNSLTNNQFYFRTYRKAEGNALEGIRYYHKTNGVYSLVNVSVGSDVSSYYVGDVYRAIINPSVDSIVYGDSLNTYRNKVLEEEKFRKTEKETYLVGAAVAGNEYEGYENGFKFDFEVSASGGLTLDGTSFKLDYKFYDKYGNEVVDIDSLYRYDEEKDLFYFIPTSGEYKVVVSPKEDGYYRASKYDESKVYYTKNLDGTYIDANTINGFETGVVYYEHFINDKLPAAVKALIKKDKENLEEDDNPYVKKFTKEFEFELTDGVNVYGQDDLKKAYADCDVTRIIIHNDIQVSLAPNQIAYIPYLNDKFPLGTSESDYAHADYGYIKIKEGSFVEMTQEEGYGPRCWSTSGTGYSIKDKEGNTYYYVGGDSSYAIKEAEWITDYANQVKEGSFVSITRQMFFSTTYDKYGIDTGSIFQRSNKSGHTGSSESGLVRAEDVVVEGNYFTIDGSKLPYAYTKQSISFSNAYHVSNVSTAFFETMSGSNSTFRNLRIVGNTSNATSSIDSDGNSLSMKEYMKRTSGGYLGLKAYEYDSTITTDNVVLTNTVLGVHIGFDAIGDVNYTYVGNTWGNGVYISDGTSLSIKNSYVGNGGASAIHLEDKYYIAGDVTHNPKVNIDLSTTIIENPISGEEPWFKAYGMEVSCLGLKAGVDAGLKAVTLNGLAPNGLTCISKFTDPVSGLTTEKMNLGFIEMNQISEPGEYATDEIVELTLAGFTHLGGGLYANSTYTKLYYLYQHPERLNGAGFYCFMEVWLR